MPYVWEDNKTLMEVNEIKIYYVYKNDMEENGPRKYWFGLTDTATEDGPDCFDVRELPNWDPDINRDVDIVEVIRQAIFKGIIYRDHGAVKIQARGDYV